MSLKRRNFIALGLLLFAAIGFSIGRTLLKDSTGHETVEATSILATEIPEQATTSPGVAQPVPETTQPGTSSASDPANRGIRRFLGYGLCFAAAAAAIGAVFGLRQTAPVLGPDGIGMLAGLFCILYYMAINAEYMMWSYLLDIWVTVASILAASVILFSIRELWGWAWAKFSLSWCLVRRLSKNVPSPQRAMLVFSGWIFLSLTGILLTQLWYDQFSFGFLAAAIFGFMGLRLYGKDLNHLGEQLNNLFRGLPVTLKEDSTFSQTEAQLLTVRLQQEEAIRAAVTSERFKVELISNVSHDLRTPLTAILGYSELLQKETLSPEGQEQLRLLHQKAGYMSELVESLFELTKVSSGVVEAKREEIDLIRLLEQTIGLFDDQLTRAGLVVRRDYTSDTIPIITDGARMHQVFANLLGNAIKYALSGTRIYLEVKETGKSCLIRMVNTSSYEMDFKPEEILQRFARGDKARSTKGSGLGLAIAQTYTESVGGSFRVGIDGDQFSAIVELPKTERNL